MHNMSHPIFENVAGHMYASQCSLIRRMMTKFDARYLSDENIDSYFYRFSYNPSIFEPWMFMIQITVSLSFPRLQTSLPVCYPIFCPAIYPLLDPGVPHLGFHGCQTTGDHCGLMLVTFHRRTSALSEEGKLFGVFELHA
ncbi:hypothetical protein EG68_11443 [Paragonimus skrjabini miyazakii]|uniref:Uncharacterized protein n=1 Tax=Paragonimus skrjabini miyazakii TaxID=59628 RepID=A0A8S9YEB7_9TREM|nr:hypothetical protein EG68_11443 [Paragonimus skrjabini miyazakii]